MFLLFNTSPVVSCDSTMSLDHISLYRDLKVTEICQHVITCHRPCELMLARVKMDGKKPWSRSESHIKRTGGARGTFKLLKSGFVISWSAQPQNVHSRSFRGTFLWDLFRVLIKLVSVNGLFQNRYLLGVQKIQVTPTK